MLFSETIKLLANTEPRAPVGQVYAVGGCVRDAVLKTKPNDFDFVVVGGDQQAMLDAGFKQVGADFPVFHHPVTGCEFSLARTERKAGVGYNGFMVKTAGVTLEDDLSRRDFTMNAMAYDFEAEQIVDPFGGQQDMEARVIKHVTSAFKDDPIRILRCARFSARFGFYIHPDTVAAVKQVADADLDALVPNRIMLEVEKAVPNFQEFLSALHVLDRSFLLSPVLGFDPARASRYPLKSTSDKDALFVALMIWGRAFNPTLKMFEGTYRYERLASLWTQHLLRWSSGSQPAYQSWAELFSISKLRDIELLTKAVDLLPNSMFSSKKIVDAHSVYSRVKASDFPEHVGVALGEAIRHGRAQALRNAGF